MVVSHRRLGNCSFPSSLELILIYYYYYYYYLLLQHDIREAPTSIKDSYKMYYKLKTSFLEETLSEALEDDSFDLSILDSSSQTDTGCSFSQSEVSAVDVSQLTSTTLSSFITDRSEYLADVSASSGNEFNKTLSGAVPESFISNDSTDFEAEKFEALNEKAWNANISNNVKKNEHSDTKMADMGAKVREHMSNKLFRNSSFSKRNPRKSLSRSSFRSSNSFSSQSGSQKEVLPDLETILSQKSQQSETEPMPSVRGALVGSAASSGSALGNQIDMQWLNRCNNTNSLEPSEIPAGVKAMQSATSETKSKYGLSNINVSALEKHDAITMASMAGNKSMLSFDMCNLNIKKLDAPVPTENKYSYSDEDEIANSEEENKTNSLEPEIRSIRHVLKKRKLNESATSPDSNQPKAENITSSTDQPTIEIRPNKKPRKKKTKVTRKRATVAVPTASRRSTRVSKVVVRKVDAFEFNSDESAEEIDPFAGDDSDGDPDFDNDAKAKQKQNANAVDLNSSVNSSDDEVLDEKPKPVKTKTVKKSITKTVKVTAIKPKTKRSVVKKKKPSTGADEAEVEGEKENSSPEDYQIEFGMDQIKSIPRIDITELKRTTEEFTKYVSKQTANIGISANSSGSGPVVGPNVRRTMDREKLAKKMESGTLNQNFRQINLRKKVFVRGKKTVNFSKYKKTMWRQKKVAALAGPDMDMGGCDGGILTCFQCGQPGHFAQNCKIKSKSSHWN